MLGAAFGLASSAAPASAQGKTDRAQAPSRCAALGPGAFEVAGSRTCVRVSGYVAAVAGFGPGPAQAFDRSNPFRDAHGNGVGARMGGRLDVTAETELGPMSLSVGVGRALPADR